MFKRPIQSLSTAPAAGARRAALIIMQAAVMAAYSCQSASPPAVPPPIVTVARPVVQKVADYLDFTGNTVALDSVQLVARVEGYLDQVHFVDGTNVKKGDLLFTIQQSQYQAQLEQAQANLLAQQAALKHAQIELKRYTGLVKQRAAPQTEVDQWQFQTESAAAGVQNAAAQVALAKLNLSYTSIRAPFDGRIGRHLVDPGNLVGSMGQQTVLAEISRIDPIYVYFTINERDLLRIIERNKPNPAGLNERVVPIYYGLSNEEGYPHEGRLDFASISVTPTTGTLQLRGIFPNPTLGVLPGLFVRVRVSALEKRDALLIPGDAVSFDQQGEYVLLVDRKNLVERRSVKSGFQVGDMLVIDQGLSADDRVITEGLLQAIPGREVNPQPAAAPAPGSARGD